MKNGLIIAALFFAGCTVYAQDFLRTAWPYASFAGQEGSTAVHMDSDRFAAWADGYTNLVYGDAVDGAWRTPQKALGPAAGASMDVVSLGRGGSITLSFSRSIVDGDGFDFAVFENAFDDYFLELAWVEVSSDGIHFVRFPDVSYTAVGSQSVLARDAYGLAGKYRQGYGTPFDLSELVDVAAYISTNGALLSAEYVNTFSNSYPHLDLQDVKYVRIIDVIGDGSAICSAGVPIYDPYPTSGSAGFDLDAVGAMHVAGADGEMQVITFDRVSHQKLSFGSCSLQAGSDSGLPVSFEVVSGPVTITNSTVWFTGTGRVDVVAVQSGDETYAAAAPVLRSFMVAEEVQVICIDQLPNLLQGDGAVQVHARSSAGLPVYLQVYRGPDAVTVGEVSHVLDPAGEAGSITLRAFQPGNARTAPAEEVMMTFNIVERGAGDAPVSLQDWLEKNGRPVLHVASARDAYGRAAVELDYPFDAVMGARTVIQSSADLKSWINAVPVLIRDVAADGEIRRFVRLPAEHAEGFYRLYFEEL